MIGSFSLHGELADEATMIERLGIARGLRPMPPGPIALGPDPAIESAEVEGVACHLEGRLYEEPGLARVLGAGRSGAELVVHTYRRWGVDGFARLRGRYSGMLWDAASRRALLFSDVLVTSQMFVWRRGDTVLFASELADLLSILPSRPAPDPKGFLAWLGQNGCPEGLTMFADVLRLSPGELWKLEDGSLERLTYWRPRYGGTSAGTPADHAEGLREVLQRSVARRMSPSATGVILSGGLDSSIVAALASQCVPPDGRLRSYSSVFPGTEWDESWKVQSLTSALEIDRSAFVIKPQGAVRLALEHTKRWAMPLPGVGALVDVVNVAEAGRDGAEIVLDGQTGDETLGFAPYLLAHRLRQGRLLAALDLTRRWPLGRPTTLQDKRWLLRNLGLRGAAPHAALRLWRKRHDPLKIAPTWLLPPLKRQFVDLDDDDAWKLRDGPLWWRHLVDTVIYTPHRETRMDYLRHRAGTAGVVNESPLYDVDVIEYCLALPPELAFDSRFTRPLAREALRGLIPDDVRLNGEKAVFSTFCQQTMTGSDLTGIEALVTAPDAAIGAYMDLDWIRQYWYRERPGAGRTSMRWGTMMWFLAATEIWLRSQSDPSFVDNMLARYDILGPAVEKVDLEANHPFFAFSGAGTS